MPFEIVLRAAGAGTLLLTAAVLLASAPKSVVARWFAPFAICVAGFVGVNTAYDAAELPDAIWPLASFASRMAAVFLWLFCLVLFDGRIRAPRVALGVVATWLVLVVIDKAYFAPGPAFVDPSRVLLVLGTALVLHAGWRVLRDRDDDLVERRRRARPYFALALLAFLALDFAVDAWQGYGWRPASFLALQNGAILVLAVALALWLLRADAVAVSDPVPLAREPERVEPSRAAEQVDPESEILTKVDSTMRADRPYLDPALTFADFAKRVGIAEPVLRRAINHRLGHGHFRHFVNGYRVEEAKRRLRDPASAHAKILAIALDSGFASLASFNRVFRQVAGCSPSAWREGAGCESSRPGFEERAHES